MNRYQSILAAKFFAALILCALMTLLLTFCTGCAPKRPDPIPTAASVKLPVEKAKANIERAKQSGEVAANHAAVAATEAAAAFKLIETLKPYPDQTDTIEQLKQRLTATISELEKTRASWEENKLALVDAETALATALERGDALEKRAELAEGERDAWKGKYEKADAAIWDRNWKIGYVSFALLLALIWIFKKPLLIAAAKVGKLFLSPV